MIEETDYARYEKLMEDALDEFLPDDYSDEELEEDIDDLWDVLQAKAPELTIEQFELMVPKMVPEIVKKIEGAEQNPQEAEAKLDALSSMRGGI